MLKRAFQLGFVSLGLALCAGVSAARADFQSPTYSFSTNNLQTNWGSNAGLGINTPPTTLWSSYTAPDGTTVSGAGLAGVAKNPFEIPQFDPNNPTIVNQPHGPGEYAVLTGVNISASYAINNSLQYTYANDTSITVNAQGSVSYTLPTSTPFTFPTPPVFKSGFNPDGTPYYRPFNPSTDTLGTPVTVAQPTLSGSYSQLFASNGADAVSAQYVGNSTVKVPVLAFATSAFDSLSGNGFGRSITDAQVDFSIYYTYKFVPEPSGLSLVAIGGVVSLWAVWRRRRSQGETVA